MNPKPVRNVREPLRKPRPLKTSMSTDQVLKSHISDPKEAVTQKTRDDILEDLEILNVSVSNCSFDEITAMDISRMCAILKKRGEELDMYNKDAVDRYFCTLRNACREDRLDILSRVKLLETIELRARRWKPNENISNYFFKKIQELENGLDNYSIGSPIIPGPVPNQNLTPSMVSLTHGEILRSSGKFEKPTKIAGKNYFKDEIVIRNADSGKVMGIKGRRVHMIEELSDTVISFQRVNPGARDRLVQITGPHEESIGHAKLLVEDTIRRNASPVRDMSDVSGFDSSKDSDFGHSFSGMDNQHALKRSLQHSFSMGDASLKEHHNIVLPIGQDLITLSGTNADLLKAAKAVLKEYFAGQSELDKRNENFSNLNRQPSPENNMQRYQLIKQSSLKNNLENNCPSSWQFNNNLAMRNKRDSVSPFSSSDDDNLREEKDASNTKLNYSMSSDSMSPLDTKFRSTPLSSENAKINRSLSVPDASVHSINSFPEIYQSDEEVFSQIISSDDPENPPIPPPSYMKVSYNREFLLKCARSPFSHNQPSDYAHIHQNFKDIINQSPVMFDPTKYEGIKSEESSGVY